MAKINDRINATALKNAMKYEKTMRHIYSKNEDTVTFIVGGYAAIRTSDPILIETIKDVIRKTVRFIPDDYFAGAFRINGKDVVVEDSSVTSMVDKFFKEVNKSAVRSYWSMEISTPKKASNARLYVIDGEDGYALINEIFDDIFDHNFHWNIFGKNSVSPIALMDGDTVADSTVLGMVLPVRRKDETVEEINALVGAVKKHKGMQ